MPKIRLIKINDYYGYHDDYGYRYSYDEFSPWQEVTDEELALLKSWQGKQILNKDNTVVVIWQDITTPEVVNDYIKDIKQFIAQEKKRQEEQKRKDQEKAAKARETAEQKKIQKAQKLLKEKGLL